MIYLFDVIKVLDGVVRHARLHETDSYLNLLRAPHYYGDGWLEGAYDLLRTFSVAMPGFRKGLFQF